MDHAPGTLVGGKFRVVRTLGRGGMGTVYEVVHEITKHHRALKLMHREVSTESVQRFLREASVAGTLGDKRIVETFDAGTLESGEPYLVMELLEGETLARRIAREGNRFPIDEAIAIVRQVALAIAVAHDKGITHRDLKPENVFLTPSGVKVLDFGVSKFTDTSEAAITREGVALGTPLYMAPEQLRAQRDLDVRVDVYALGVMLYEAIAGRRPFDAETMTALVVKINEGEATPLATNRPDVPPALAATIARAMHRDRDQRPKTARLFADSLSVDPLAATAEDIALSATAPLVIAKPLKKKAWIALLAIPVVAGMVWVATRKPADVAPPPPTPVASPSPSPIASPPPVASSSSVVASAIPSPRPSASAKPPPSKHSAAGLTENPL